MGTPDTASPFGLGCVSLGSFGDRNGVRLVSHALELGVRFFDTADAYGAGASERVLGRALRRRRDRAILATKAGYVFRERSALANTARLVARPVIRRVERFGRPVATLSSPLAGLSGYASQDFSVRHLRTALEASLRRLGTDYVDIYQLHGPNHVCADEVLALMLDLRSEGKILGFGVGLESVNTAMAWLGTGALASIQIPFGVLDPEAGDEAIPRAMAEGVRVVVRGVFAGGCLVDRQDGGDASLRPGQADVRMAVRKMASATGFDALQIATWFVTTRSGVTTVLVGTSSARHLEESFRYVQTRPPDHMLPRINALSARRGETRPTDHSPRDGRGP
jgi:aryl-alcohol dehydrogenase-like predicted oxidoreductase